MVRVMMCLVHALDELHKNEGIVHGSSDCTSVCACKQGWCKHGEDGAGMILQITKQGQWHQAEAQTWCKTA